MTVNQNPDDLDPERAALRRLVEKVLIRDEVESLDRPHALAITHGDGQVTFEGPFPDGFTALAVADRRRLEFQEQGDWFEDDPTDDLAVLSIRIGPIIDPPAAP